MPPGAPPAARFQKQSELGRGPLGTVHRAQDLVNGRALALRVLPARTPESAAAFASLLEDLKAAGRLSHPGLVRALGMFEVEGRAEVLCELVEGYDLDAALAAGPLSEARVKSVASALVSALQHVHDNGQAHGSVRPSNVMFAGGIVRLADLGLGRLFQVFGPESPYRPPEGGLTSAGDVYSLGAVLLHALTGEPPDGPGAPEGSALVDLIAACMADDPGSRPTATQLASRLEALA